MATEARHPIQPVIEAETDGTGNVILRFKANAIVRFLLHAGPFNMNDIARKDFSREDREQFAQLIGYSLNGAAELDYMSNEVLTAADEMRGNGVSELEARNAFLREKLEIVRDGMREGAAVLFGVHPDDLAGEGE